MDTDLVTYTVHDYAITDKDYTVTLVHHDGDDTTEVKVTTPDGYVEWPILTPDDDIAIDNSGMVPAEVKAVALKLLLTKKGNLR